MQSPGALSEAISRSLRLPRAKTIRLRRRTRLTLPAAAAATVLLLSHGAKAADPKHPTIAVFTKNFTNPAYENFRIGADKAAAAGGMTTRHYVPNKPDDVEEQRALVDRALEDKPDIVLFVAVDDVAMVPTLRKFRDAAIPVITAVSQIEADVVTSVTSDDVDVGRREATYLFEKMGKNGRIVILEGIASSPTSRDRKKGYDEALKNYPGIQVLDSKVANYQRTDARNVTQQMLSSFPRIEGVLAANDVMALGALDVLSGSGRAVEVAGVNGQAEAIQKIMAGSMLVSVDFSTFNMACIATQAAIRHRDGASVPLNIVLPIDVIDKTNAHRWQTPAKDRSCPSWSEMVR